MLGNGLEVLLIGIGFLAGIVTALSPCVLPVLPIIFGAGAVGEHRTGAGLSATTTGRFGAAALRLGRARRPLAIASGVALSFGLAELFASSVLSLLGLPQDLLTDVALVCLGVAAVGLFVPAIGELLGRPFTPLGRYAPGHRQPGFLMGLGLGLVFTPCAGPVLSAISVAGSRHQVGAGAAWLAIAYCTGIAVPLFGFALAGDHLLSRAGWVRQHALFLRRSVAVVLLAAVVLIWSGATAGLSTLVPGYTNAFTSHVESSPSVQNQLNAIEGQKGGARRSVSLMGLSEYGVAPRFSGITAWLNTPGDKPLDLASLRGHVVLVDFWTYSCINCRRSLPHVEAWYRAYHSYGLDVVGVHTPEFSFEHVVSNVAAAAAQLGVQYPIAVDDNASTWTAYRNNYWPAEYLVDGEGRIRYYDFGEGGYSHTELLIRELLEGQGARLLPPPTDVADRTPTGALTPESYLGYTRLDNLANPSVTPDTAADYSFPASLPQDELAYSGEWDVESEDAVSGTGAALALDYYAREVYLVLGGSGTVQVLVNGRPTSKITVSGVPNLYTMVSAGSVERAVLELRFSPGVAAYDFTFG
ncbi:MAG: cytochrome c biogenesis protein CcdA [Acidimicrobiales bacterium]